jgi:trehalose 6-phosphate phosphatase
MTRDFDFEDMRSRVADVSRLFLVSDFDGTLAPIAHSPERVELQYQTRELLNKLTEQPKVVLAIISGRSLRDVLQKAAIPAIYGGNHGLELSGPGIEFVHPEVSHFEDRLDHVCTQLEQDISAWSGAWIENKTLTATVHFREVPVAQWPMLISSARMRVASHQQFFRLRSGHAALEITPRLAWDKGAALQYLRQKLELEDALTICLGDDTTDESMFRAVQDGVTIRVGRTSHTEAAYCMPGGVDEVTRFLGDLVETIEATTCLSAVSQPRSGVCR